ncbi:MAG: CRTAC1 family protein [Planctomycetes bacterium]|nr:CRTAC1 family protein [Planctomycetota bacterium]
MGAWFGDYDLDGDPDLYLTCAGPNRLYRNDGEGRFTDVTAASGTAGGAFLSVGAAWADFDHDGDLDLFVANWSAWPVDPAKPPGAPNALLRNNGTGTFTDVAAQCGVDGGMVASIGVQVLDLDDDRDLDLCVINHGESSRLFRNDRVGRYADATDLLPGFAEAAPGTGACVADVDGNGLEDLLLLRGRQPPRLWLQESRGRFAEDRSFAALIGPQSGAVGGTFADLDLDGDLDLVLVGAGSSDRVGHRLLMNHGRGRFSAPVTFGPQNALPDARGTVATDLDGDGAIDLLVARAGATPQLWRCNPPAGRNWLVVEPGVERAQDAAKPEPMVVGLHVEVKAGLTVQVARVAATSGCLGSAPPLLHFGLGAKRKADYVRLLWPDAVLQSEMEVAAGQRWRVAKVERKPSSCPVLFVWDGSRFAFVTDFLGTGGVGFFVEPGVYAPPDPTEDVRIPPELVAQDRGRYLLRVTEPLEEVTYLDQLELRVYDHPAGYEVHPDERFTSTPPFPTGAPILIAEKVFPVAAHDDRGEPVLDRLIEIDRRYCEPPALAGFKGYAADHWFELDFGDRLHALPSGSMPWLFLHGFVEYTYSHVNYAAWQAGLAMRPPSIEVPDGRGGWRTAIADAGFPAGLPRTMTVDLSSLPLGADGRLRLRTNMRVFWDQAFVAVEAGSTELVRSVLAPSVAELRFLGYPRDYSPDGAEPTIHDYQRVDPSAAFKAMTGDFTRYGDVRALLAAADDRYVLMARGDEIALEFDASALPPLTPGFARTLVLHADGWCKDMDLYTAFPDTVEPLPFHGMTNYPPDTAPPADLERDEVLRRFNTRRHEGR